MTAKIKMRSDPSPAVGPCRNPLFNFAFGCALMVLTILLMPNPRAERNNGGAARADQLPMIVPPPPTMNNVATMEDSAIPTKPTLLLHMGPPKTSTSFLQCILTNMIDTLALDNYVYFGLHIWPCRRLDIAYPTQWQGTGRFPFEQPRMAVFSPTFINDLRETHRQGKNAMIMAEAFKNYTPEQRKLVMDEFTTNWNVKVVLNYRRVYELLPSGYNQMHKPNKFASSYEALTIWPGETNENGIVGKALFPFDIDDTEYFDATQPSVVVVQEEYSSFSDVTVIKLHELNRTGTSGDAILQEMFCNIVGNTMPHSCAAVQLDETVQIGSLASNPYYSFNYDMLATAAYEKQLFGFQKRNEQTPLPLRRDVADMVQHYQEDTLQLMHNDFTTICLAKEKMDFILDISIISEKVVYGSDNWTSQHEVDIRQAFLDYQEKRPYIYCWIDTEKTLQDPKWLAFFDSI